MFTFEEGKKRKCGKTSAGAEKIHLKNNHFSHRQNQKKTVIEINNDVTAGCLVFSLAAIRSLEKVLLQKT